VTETYVCPNCGETQERPYRVKLIVLTCPVCGENGYFLNDSLVSLLDDIPESERPADWGEMNVEERMRYAVKEDLVDANLVLNF
jgi:hypothetical protein